jgi:cobyrinic acid a,c-diamide synthase
MPRIVIAGPESGAGKTTVTVGLIAALRRQGLVVQPYKAGPDYIDPGFHTAAAGRSSRCLDTWMLDDAALRGVLARGGKGADLSVVEGVMGFYDGKDPTGLTGSTAELSIRLQAPVLLVLDAAKMARSAAAVVLGFQRLEPEARIAGVVVNRVGGEGHYRLLAAAIGDACGIPVLGWLPHDAAAYGWPERHLGLVPAAEREAALAAKLERLADDVAGRFDLARIVRLAREAPALAVPLPAAEPGAGHGAGSEPAAAVGAKAPPVRIAVARDEALHFYYEDNLELLVQAGAELVYFSPLRGEPVPADADGLYLGGGFPEQYAAELSERKAMLASLRERIGAGMPTFAECGGYMLLAREIVTLDGVSHLMAGVVPGRIVMQPKLAAIGYREVTAAAELPLLARGETARGHEFHYSTIILDEGAAPAYASARSSGGEPQPEGFATPTLAAGYTHLHFGSNPRMAHRFVAACAAFRAGRRSQRL